MVYLLLDTSEFFRYAGNCTMIISLRNLNLPSSFGSFNLPKFLLDFCFTLRTYSLRVSSSLARFARRHSTQNPLGKALVRLVSVGLKCCHSYTSDLSTTYSAWGLTGLCHERSYLTVGFVLICFQHLSAWNTATGRLPLAR